MKIADYFVSILQMFTRAENIKINKHQNNCFT